VAMSLEVALEVASALATCVIAVLKNKTLLYTNSYLHCFFFDDGGSRDKVVAGGV